MLVKWNPSLWYVMKHGCKSWRIMSCVNVLLHITTQAENKVTGYSDDHCFRVILNGELVLPWYLSCKARRRTETTNPKKATTTSLPFFLSGTSLMLMNAILSCVEWLVNMYWCEGKGMLVLWGQNRWKK